MYLPSVTFTLRSKNLTGTVGRLPNLFLKIKIGTTAVLFLFFLFCLLTEKLGQIRSRIRNFLKSRIRIQKKLISDPQHTDNRWCAPHLLGADEVNGDIQLDVRVHREHNIVLANLLRLSCKKYVCFVVMNGNRTHDLQIASKAGWVVK